MEYWHFNINGPLFLKYESVKYSMLKETGTHVWIHIMLTSKLIEPDNINTFSNQNSCLTPISAVADEEVEEMKL